MDQSNSPLDEMQEHLYLLPSIKFYHAGNSVQYAPEPFRKASGVSFEHYVLRTLLPYNFQHGIQDDTVNKVKTLYFALLYEKRVLTWFSRKFLADPSIINKEYSDGPAWKNFRRIVKEISAEFGVISLERQEDKAWVTFEKIKKQAKGETSTDKLFEIRNKISVLKSFTKSMRVNRKIIEKLDETFIDEDTKKLMRSDKVLSLKANLDYEAIIDLIIQRERLRFEWNPNWNGYSHETSDDEDSIYSKSTPGKTIHEDNSTTLKEMQNEILILKNQLLKISKENNELLNQIKKSHEAYNSSAIGTRHKNPTGYKTIIDQTNRTKCRKTNYKQINDQKYTEKTVVETYHLTFKNSQNLDLFVLLRQLKLKNGNKTSFQYSRLTSNDTISTAKVQIPIEHKENFNEFITSHNGLITCRPWNNTKIKPVKNQSILKKRLFYKKRNSTKDQMIDQINLIKQQIYKTISSSVPIELISKIENYETRNGIVFIIEFYTPSPEIRSAVYGLNIQDFGVEDMGISWWKKYP